LLLHPIFADTTFDNNVKEKNNDIALMFPTATPEQLSDAIIEVVEAEAKIINLSLGLTASSLVTYHKLQEAYHYALRHGVIIIVAAGNQGNIGSNYLLHDKWIVPVTACNERGQLSQISNFGPSIGSRGLMAPGINITSTNSGGGYVKMNGTSIAVPFITGAIALLWSLFPMASAADLINAVRIAASSNLPHRSIIPPLLNVEAAYNILQSTAKT
jgi:subtilisin family serine protease